MTGVPLQPLEHLSWRDGLRRNPAKLAVPRCGDQRAGPVSPTSVVLSFPSMTTTPVIDAPQAQEPEGVRLPGVGGSPTPPRAMTAAEEAARLASLRRMKVAATGLLVLAAVIYVIAHALEPAHPWLGYVRATAEASLVGGIADWFAVTALFRRPLGLPIPHTAIMQTQKDRIGRILGNFVQNHFLSREVLAARLLAIRPAERMGAWLVAPGQAGRLSHQLAGALARTVEVLPDAEVKALVQRGAVDRLETIRLAPLLGDVLTVATAGPWPTGVLDQCSSSSADAAAPARVRSATRYGGGSALGTGRRQGRGGREDVSGFERSSPQVSADPGTPSGHGSTCVAPFIERLNTRRANGGPELLKHDLLGHPMVEELAGSIWDRVRRAAEQYRANPDATSLAPVEAALVSVGESLAESDQLRADVDDFLAEVASAFLEQHRHEVADLIAATVRDWTRTCRSRIELAADGTCNSSCSTAPGRLFRRPRHLHPVEVLLGGTT